MSMISEQIKTLRYHSLDSEIDMLGVRELQKLFEEAADTIKELSEKLASANMERSTAYYNDGWIPCSERLPDESGKYTVCTAKGSVYCAKFTVGKKGKFFHTDMYTHIIAWQPLPAPYKPKGEKEWQK